jgi:hypothetical protein
MAARKKTTAKGTRGRPARQTLAKLESELPRTLAEFSKRVRKELTGLEVRVEKAAAPTRREIARVLRQASHALGRYEAEGEKQWKRLTGQARREALSVLRRLEKAVAPPRRRVARKKTALRKRRVAA